MSSTFPAAAALPARAVAFRPSAAELRALAEATPAARPTRYGSLNLRTRVRARASASTFLVTDDPEPHGHRPLGREAAARLARLQDGYMAAHDMVVVDGHLGHGGPCRSAARLVVERAGASVAAMQRELYVDPLEGGGPHDPALTVIDTPGLAVPGFPGRRVVAVWLEEGVTRIAGTDFFDEAKKAALRMLGARVQRAGGVLLHAACTVVPATAGPRAMLLAGRSGAGKSTLAFSGTGGARLVQDDFVALLPGGRVVASEGGCIEKTCGLDPAGQPAIHAAATRPDAWLENVPQRGREPDFADPAGQVGRAVFGLGAIPGRWPAADVPPAAFLVVVHPGGTVVPAVARLSPEQAAACLLLREQGGPAGGPDRAGATPPAEQVRHALRLAELVRSAGIGAYLLNTGRVGGTAGDERARSVLVEDSRAILAAIAAGSVAWGDEDPAGYRLADEVPGVDAELLRPRRLYERQRRRADHREDRERLAGERARYLAGFPGLDPAVAAALDGRRGP
ncbi:MAG TPA: phosphoenolpyruvate carboxykinase (ATP) [Actinomycetes bacterium]|nr:phosphoenolpyruvate carboxykinase (ATP) [Actinomycetes bacterium]